jgi:hypothetical protein
MPIKFAGFSFLQCSALTAQISDYVITINVVH